MTAQVVHLGRSVAERYARFMSLGFSEECREQAFIEHLAFGQQLAAGGYTHADLQTMIDAHRARLTRELAGINRV